MSVTAVQAGDGKAYANCVDLLGKVLMRLFCRARFLICRFLMTAAAQANPHFSMLLQALRTDLILYSVGLAEDKNEEIFRMMARTILAEVGSEDGVYLAPGKGAAIWILKTGESVSYAYIPLGYL